MIARQTGPADLLRQRAEDAVLGAAKHPNTPHPATTPQDLQRTVHELRVHQVELEMQNDELRQTQNALNAARLHYADLYNLAPVGYCTVNDAGHILEANRSATALLGASGGGLVAQIFNRFIDDADADTYYLLCKKLFKTGCAQSDELRMVRQDGAPLWVHVAVSAADGALGTPVLRIVLTDMTERKTARDQIQELAFYDPLTGLPNRRLLMDRLALAMSASQRHQRQGALLFVDLDDFKTINDTLGHHQGDLVLAQVAGHLSACIREGDTVARWGGDEFVVMLERLSENTLSAATLAKAVGEKILATLNRTYPAAAASTTARPASALPCLAVAWRRALTSPSSGPTWPCTRPRRRAAMQCAFLIPRCKPSSAPAPHWTQVCAMPFSRNSFFCSTKRRWTAWVGSPVPRPWCAGSILSVAWCPRRSSSPKPKNPG
jgi:diguanylate cyclase (GGDEF)-like protein/PAS domain S-box-containing protein